MSLREFFGTSSFFCLATPQAVVQLVTVLDVRFFYFYHRQSYSLRSLGETELEVTDWDYVR